MSYPDEPVEILDADTPVAEARHALAASGHSRAPVVRHGNLDETLGVVHMRNLITDEGAAADGIVTLEDLLEEIVGEIYDETDRDLDDVRTEPGGTLVVPGAFPVHDLPDIGVRLTERSDGSYATLAGLLLVMLGRIPDRPGDTVRLGGWTAEVLAVKRHAITSVRLRPNPN